MRSCSGLLMPAKPTLLERLAQRAARLAELAVSNEKLLAENAGLQEQLKLAQQKVTLLEQKLDALVRRLFGSKSEKLLPGQLELLLSGEPAPAPPGKADACWAELDQQAKRPKPPAADPAARRMRVPDDLPVEEEIIEPAEVLQAPELYRRIGEEVNERLDYTPGRFLRLRTVRPTYVRRRPAEGEIPAAPLTAPLPPMLQERGTMGPGLVAHILVSKYVDHLPLYRQESIYRQRHGVELPRQSLARMAPPTTPAAPQPWGRRYWQQRRPIPPRR